MEEGISIVSKKKSVVKRTNQRHDGDALARIQDRTGSIL